MTEIWKPVVGFEGLYEVSNHGNVRSVDRVVPHPTSGRLTLKGREIKQTRAATGKYQIVNLWRHNKQKPAYVHALVLEAFIGPRPPSHDACHWDGDRSNNLLSNLRWGTRKENMADAVRHGTTTKGWNYKMGTPWQPSAA